MQSRKQDRQDSEEVHGKDSAKIDPGTEFDALMRGLTGVSKEEVDEQDRKWRKEKKKSGAD